MIKILWIASNAPYSGAPAAGSQTFNYYFKKFCADENFDVRLICWGEISKKAIIEKENSDIIHKIIYTEPSIKAKIKKVCNIESSYNLWNRYANLISNYCVKEILKTLKEYKASAYIPDIIVLEWTNIVVMAEDIKKFYPSAKLVASEHDVTFVGYERKKQYYKGIRGLIWNIKFRHEKKKELKALKVCNLVLPHNGDNKSVLIKEKVANEKIQWLLPYYKNLFDCNRRSNGRDILFYGAMSRPENYLSAIWFIENVMPKITDLDIRFIIVGNRPAEILNKYKSDRIVITGFVENIEPYFEQSLCFVAPLILGAGIKVKILEALSSGIPVLTNHIGIEGIHAPRESVYFHCESAGEYEEKIRKLYNKSIDEEQILYESRKFIGQHFDIENSWIQYRNQLIKLCDFNIANKQ